jgi:hypothetical protein
LTAIELLSAPAAAPVTVTVIVPLAGGAVGAGEDAVERAAAADLAVAGGAEARR